MRYLKSLGISERWAATSRPLLVLQPGFYRATVTSHVLVQTQRHAHVTDLDGLEVALDDHVAGFHVTVQQLPLVVEIL